MPAFCFHAAHTRFCQLFFSLIFSQLRRMKEVVSLQGGKKKKANVTELVPRMWMRVRDPEEDLSKSALKTYTGFRL